MIDKIIISSDLTRLDANLQSFHTLRIDKYFNLLSWQIRKSCNLPVIKLKANNKQWDTFRFYQFFGIHVKDEFDWVKIYDVKKIPKNAIEYYGELIKNSLVIYIEASETIKRIHNILNIPYIDLTVHPVRFLSDNYFGAATNNSNIERVLSENRIDPRYFESQAQLVRTQSIQEKLYFKPNSLLIIGQTELDKALIRDGRLYSFYDYKDKLIEIIKEFDNVYFKPHPYRKDNESIESFLRSICNLEVTHKNIYKILPNNNIKGVAGLSSSAIYEARFFEKKRFFLKKAFVFDFENPKSKNNVFYSIGTEILNPSFWIKVLDALNIETLKDYLDFRMPCLPNQIRTALNDFWAQTEIDPAARICAKYLEGTKQLTKLKIEHKDLEQSDIKGFKKKLIRKSIDYAEKIPLGKNLIEAVLFFACRQFLTKNKKDVSYGENVNVNTIHCITYRPEAPFGGRGGAGAVVSAMKAILGSKYLDKNIVYSFSEADGIWHTAKNKYFNKKRFPVVFSDKSDLINLWANLIFVRDLTRTEKAVYIAHEYGTAYALSLLGKKYSLVLHSQGPRVEEKIKLGEKLSFIAKKIISYCEKIAVKNANVVYFPSKGACESFFNSKYCEVDRNKVNLGGALYNTLYVDIKPAEVKEINSLSGLKFISVGTCTEAKGFDNTIKYLGKILQTTNREISWIWVGKGPLEDKVQKLADELSKKHINFKYIHFRKIPFNQVQYLLLNADIYIMLHRKSIFDLATLEAMKAGCALLLSPLEGNLEFNVCDNVLFANETPLVIDPKKIEELKEKNKLAYQNFFSNEKFRREYEKVVNDLLQ